MSFKSRLKGLGSGLLCGAIAPLAATIGIPFMITGSTGGSGAGPAIACVLCAVTAVIGGLALVGGAGLAALLSIGGVPWFVTVPAVYFGIWGLIGIFGFGKEDKLATSTASV